MNPGLRNGFIDLWPEYLEIITVQDEAAFAADDDPGNDYLRGARGGPPGPGALELYSEDVARLREAMTTAGHQVPVVVESRMAGTDAKDRPVSGELATADRLVRLHLLSTDPHATVRAMSAGSGSPWNTVTRGPGGTPGRSCSVSSWNHRLPPALAPGSAGAPRRISATGANPIRFQNSRDNGLSSM